MKPLEKEFGELLAKRKSLYWYNILDAISVAVVICSMPVALSNWIIFAPILIFCLVVFWLGQAKRDTDARLKEIGTIFERRGLAILNDPANNVTVYLKNSDEQKK
ncbi:hypothetical protein [Planktotalea sp.]|uniref:hypothetical protein n=1 Tax=Planktotalea sp. TaxID=2029877 RepID=UPI00329952C0